MIDLLKTFASTPSAECNTETFLFFTSWYEGLICEDGGDGGVIFDELNTFWAILGNVLSFALELAGLLAVFFLIYGGVRYITSQGQPEHLQAAKKTITYAIAGLIIAILATTIVGFIAGRF